MDERFSVPDWMPMSWEHAMYGELKEWTCPFCGTLNTDFEGTFLLMCEWCAAVDIRWSDVKIKDAK